MVKTTIIKVMTSIIICSKQEKYSLNIGENIKSTIGDSFELLCINNSQNKFSIFEAYEQGVLKAQGDILVFIHEDILFRTKNWGLIVRNILSKEKTGIVGVIGGHIIDETSLSWTTCGYYSGQVVQIDNQQPIHYDHSKQGLGTEVVAVDGMFIAIRKELFDKRILFWDKKTYTGFHFYDLDICMQAKLANYKIKIVPILLEHHSKGAFNQSFYESCKQFHQKWDYYLPVTSPDVSFDMQKKSYQKALEKTCDLGIRFTQQANIFQKWQYKIVTKILLLFGHNPYSC